MLLNDNVAKLIHADKKLTIGFDYWLRLSTLESGKPIMIPILSNDYFNSIDGKILHAAQFNFDKKGALTVALMKDVPKKIIDFKSEEIYTIHSNDVMNPWRPFLLFAKNNSNWEPIRNQDKKLLFSRFLLKRA
jgi:hypothetical protein